MNTATRSIRKAKSGLPKIGRCRRHPVILAVRRSLTNAISVRSLPLDLMRDMISERFAAVNTSGMAHEARRFGRRTGEGLADLHTLATNELGRQSVANHCGSGLLAGR